ncbi:hypothetical protein JX265_005068 [Neoarthrinium moseri]|uniref:Asl1-like glycosyl hydrolase catalytic domain-containing protein n=1 Tax=Neoarthrinium moseri TaxID=1658444 RepID=A0A9Q0ARK9_9PEZI|nr:hypothetical protein JX265_005068 [Neoarthrinium moseri]
MFTKYIVPAALCATNLVEASSRHRHMHKRDYIATEVEIVTDYVTVTVYEGEEGAATAAAADKSFYAASRPSTTSIVVPEASTSASVVVAPSVVAEPAASSPTTLATSVVVAPSSVQTEAAAVPTTYAPNPVTTTEAATSSTSTAAATTSVSSGGSGSTSGKRGLAYNSASLVSSILSVGSSKFDWCYDWGFNSGGLTADITYIPMLWGPTHYTSAWDTAAEKAISDNVGALFSFNECDNAGQANLAAADAANYHQQYLNPYKGRISIGAPSITSSASAGQGLDWLSAFMTACSGNCAVDFINLHWYGPGGQEGATEFLAFLDKAHEQFSLPVWVTEFAATSGDETEFMTYALEQLDTNSAYNYVQKYSYFYTDTLFSGTTLTSLGQTYATA